MQLLTIGELAKRAGLRASALRFYEAQGLLTPSAHTDAGYRLYDATAEETLRFIQRAQRLGFALANIKTLLESQRVEDLRDTSVLTLARERYVALEQQLTPLLVLRHELGLFLRDLQHAPDSDRSPSLSELIDQVCAAPHAVSPDATLEQLLTATGCIIASDEGRSLLAQLRGHHVHLWQEGDTYHILVVDNDPAVGQVLERLARLDAGCYTAANGSNTPELRHIDEGFLFIARGPHAFLFARLFLALEQEGALLE